MTGELGNRSTSTFYLTGYVGKGCEEGKDMESGQNVLAAAAHDYC